MDEAQPGDITERRHLTVLFCDLVGSTELGERLDPETLRTVQAAYFDRTRSVIGRFGGTVEKFIGDAVVAVFGIPLAHEDDAERAVRCGMSIQEALAGLNDTLRSRFSVELAARIGISSGEAVIAGDPSNPALATGDVMNSAARLEQAAGPGEVLVGRETMVLSRSSVEFGDRRTVEARGKAQPVEAWVPLTVSPSARRLRPPMVGRRSELESLAGVLEQVVRSRAPRVALVIGEPGIGKSRLAEEFAARVMGRARVSGGPCLRYGEGTAWQPVTRVVRDGAGIVDSDPPGTTMEKLQLAVVERHPSDEALIIAAQLGALMGATGGAVGSGPELLWSLRRYIEAMAAGAPLVVVFDDLQFAGETLMETVLELIGTVEDVPIVWLCLGRPELMDRTTELVGTDGTTVVKVAPLADDEVASLAAHLVDAASGGRRGLAEQDLTERASGNPLFLEELVAMEAEEGSSHGAVPATLRALIAARLDVLPMGAKRVAQAAAVVGDVFWDAAAAALLHGAWEGDAVASALRALRSRGLIEEERPGRFIGRRQFRFHHGLVREVAYASVSKQDRANMHQLAAAWLQPEADRQPALLGVVANHLDQALSLSTAIAPGAPADPRLVEEAIDRLLAAGAWTASNGAQPEAVALLRKAVAASVLSPGRRPLCTARLASVLAVSGELDEAAQLAEEVLAGDATGEPAALASLALAEAGKTRGIAHEMRLNGQRALERSQGAFPAVEARALDVLASAAFWLGENLDAEHQWKVAAECALRAGDEALAARAMANLSLSATLRLETGLAEEWVGEAMGMTKRSGSLMALVATKAALTRLLEFQDRLDEALEQGREWVRLAVEAGQPYDAGAGCVFGQASPLMHLGRIQEVWGILEQALDINARMGTSAYIDNIRLERAKVLAMLGRIDEARDEMDALRLLPQLDVHTSVLFPAWARAFIETAAGEYDNADRAWREGMEAAGSWTEEITVICDYYLDYAGYLFDRGRDGDAAVVVDQLAALIDGTDSPLYRRLLRDLQARSKR